VNKFHYLKGGADRCYLESSQLLESKGHQVVFFSMLHERNRETPYARYFVDNVEFFDEKRRNLPAMALRVLYSLEARRKIESLVADTAPEIAHLHNIAHQLSPSILHSLAKLCVPVVQTIHDFKFACPTYSFFAAGKTCEACKGNRYYNAVFRRCNRGSLPASLLNCVEMYLHKLIRIYDNVDLFITPSQFVKEKMVEYGFSPERIVRIPNFILANEYLPAYTPGNYFVFFGRLVPYKGVATLLQAMESITDSQLYIVGEGQMRSELETYAREHHLQHVAFLGHKSGEELKSIVSNSMFSVVPSECYENLPYAILESFALGTPVLAANIGGIPELVEPGVNGLLFEPGNVADLADKIRYLLVNRQSLASMGKEARAKIEREHDPETYYERLMQAYGRVL
jgi:glycosyltransferase involved in cell wall biosynthesis